MKKYFILSIFLFLSFSQVVIASDGLFDFLKSANNNSSSSVLVIFYKDECPYCQKMNTSLQQDEVFSSMLMQKFSIQKINITTPDGRALADRFNVHSVPTIINFDTRSGVLQTIKGFPGINKMAALLNIAYKTYVVNETAVSNNSLGCGDGIIDAGEQCDDANTINNDGCSATCNIETGYICTGTPSVCMAVCGDGIVASSEGCDDGNGLNGDGCNSSCNIEPGFICTGSPSVCVSTAPANNDCSGAISLSAISGTIQGDNALATNSPVTAPSCQASWQKDIWYKFTIAATKPVSLAVNGISMSDPVIAIYSGSCGALVEVGCDDDSGPGNFSLFTANLAAGTYYVRILGFGAGAQGQGTFNLVYNLNGICGNNIIEFSEECDDGNITSGDGCSSTCTFENAGNAKGVSINEDGVRANPSSMLDVKSDSKGVLIPRLTTAQRTAIVSPAIGLIAFDINTKSFWYYKTGGWSEISGSSGTGFSAFNGSNQAFTGQFDPTTPTELYDDGNNFATSTFTAPVFAIYDLSSYAIFTFSSVSTQTVITLNIFNKTTSTVYSTNSIIIPAGFSGTVRLNTAMSTKINAGSPLGVRVQVSGTPGLQQLSYLEFSGYRVY
jgi:cysteine-rich repeat protein